jgi:polyisoprenoid-binding protein YceI
MQMKRAESTRFICATLRVAMPFSDHVLRMFMKSTLMVLFLTSIAFGGTATWHAGQSDVRVVCPMTVGGSFAAKSTALSGSVTPAASGSPAFEGTFAVDLRTLDTGIGLRNEHLRNNYLEVDKGSGYDQAVVSEIELKGLNPDAPAGKGSFTGSLSLHGVKKAVAGSVDVRPAGGGLRVRASFPVSLSDYGIPEPRYMGIGVKNTVQVEVAFAVTP